MNVCQYIWEDHNWVEPVPASASFTPSLVVFFGGHSPEETTAQYHALRKKFPEVDIIGCSTAGEIAGLEVMDHGGVATGLRFEQTPHRISSLTISASDESETAGQQLAATLAAEDLQLVLVLSDGNIVNGSALVEGLRAGLGKEVPVSGGLAGDGGRFLKTGVVHNGEAVSGQIVCVGFYGESLILGTGSVGGWTPFGPVRTITRSASNVLQELDGKPALGLYKTYLGDAASQLPGSALSFPIMIRPDQQREQDGLVRTILSIDEQAQSLTFAGDTPEGFTAQLMMASYESLVEGAGEAASDAAEAASEPISGDSLVVMISCVGRKIVLGSRIEEEVEAVMDEFSGQKWFAGYYSYGEISPMAGACELHNQTMTVTYLAEKL